MIIAATGIIIIVAIYVRVSTEDQARTGYSIDTQLEACRAAAKALDATKIVEYIDDGYSGEFLDRPEMDRLRHDIQNQKYTYVICYDPDRLARKLAHQLIITDEIEKTGAELKFVSVSFEHSPEGKLFYSIRGAISEFEKEKIKERTTRGKRGKAAKGKLVLNDKPLGYDYDPKECMYVINEKEAERIRFIYNTVITKHCGVRRVVAELRARGMTTKNGKPFYPTGVYVILTNPMYKGLKCSHRFAETRIGQSKTKKTRRDPSEWIYINVPAIVDNETWDEAQRIIKTNKKFSKRNNRVNYLLRNIIRCGNCGYAGVSYAKRNGDKEYTYYSCSSRREHRGICEVKDVRADLLDKMVWEKLLDYSESRISLPILHKAPVDNGAKERLEQILSELKDQQADVLRWYRAKIIEPDAAERELQKVSREIAATQSMLTETQHRMEIIKLNPADIKNAETFEQRRAILLRSGLKVFAQKVGPKPEDIDWGFTQ